MGITGNIGSMEFPELLQWLARSRKTGTLVVTREETRKEILFKEGQIVSTASSEPKEHLGHFLVSHGFLDEVTLAQAVKMQQEKGILMGKILTTIGAIDQKKLERMLQLKAQETIYDIFTWPEAQFEFEEDALAIGSMVPIFLDVESVVLRGAKRLDDWNRIRKIIPSAQCIPVATGKLVAPEGDASAKRILGVIDDDRTIEEIALQTHSSEFNVCRVLFKQVRAGRIKIVRPREVGQASAEERPAPVPTTFEPRALLVEARKHLKSKQLDIALRHIRAARHLDPDDEHLQAAVDEIEGAIREQLESSGMAPTAIPHLDMALEELASLQLSAQEGFIVSRLDGTLDIQTIEKISPMGKLETEVVLWKLLQAGHIRLDYPE